MSLKPAIQPPPRPPSDVPQMRVKRRWVRSMLLGSAGLLGLTAALGTGLWFGRAPISKAIVSDYLSAKGIAVSYDLVSFSNNRLVLRNIVAGTVGNPDFAARQITLDYALGWRPKLSRVVIEGGRLRAGLDAQGRWSIGALDALRPAPSDEPLELPGIMLVVMNSSLNLITPYGVLQGAIEANGMLDQRAFLKAALKSPQMAQGEHRFDQVALELHGQTTKDQVSFTLALKAAQARVAGLDADAFALEAQGSTSLAFKAGNLNGTIKVGALKARYSQEQALQAQRGQLRVAARVQREGQSLALISQWRAELQGLAAPQGQAQRFEMSGAFALKSRDAQNIALQGNAGFSLQQASANPQPVLKAVGALAGTPLAPFGAILARNVRQTARAFDAQGMVNFTPQQFALHDFSLSGAQGLRLSLTKAPLVWQQGRLSLEEGIFGLKGVGVPNFRANLTLAPLQLGQGQLGQGQLGQRLRARARINPFDWRAQGASLESSALDIRFKAGQLFSQGQLRFSGQVGTAQTPVFLKNLTLPLNTSLSLGPSLRVNVRQGCLPVQAERIEATVLSLGPTRLQICQTQPGAFFQVNQRQGPSGRWHIDKLHLIGTAGRARQALPLQAQAERLDLWLLAGRRLALVLKSATARIEQLPERVITLGMPKASLAWANNAGTLQAKGIMLDDPQLPVTLNEAVLEAAVTADGRIDLTDARVTIADKAPEARFEPLLLTKAQGKIADAVLSANAELHLASTQQFLGSVRAQYQFDTAQGDARLRIQNLAFNPEFELFNITELARGVVENVRGLVDVDADVKIAENLSATGRVVLRDLSFATAALGPVDGVNGTLVFDDFLAFTTPPGQRITIASLNPGIPINAGDVRLQFLSPTQVRIEQAEWPLAGGTLFMVPSLLEPQADVRRLTFRVRDIDIAQFIQQLDFKNLNATGRVEGVFPLVFSREGSRIEGGVLRAQAGGGTIQYVGSLSNNTTGASQLAFDALRSFRYDSIEIDVNGDLAGEIVTAIRFAGTNQAPLKPLGGNLAGVPVKAEGLPFRFRVRIQAPFRSLLGTADRVTNPTKLLNQATPIDAGGVPGSGPPLPVPENSGPPLPVPENSGPPLPVPEQGS